jgi:hypothetical protein
MDWIILIKVVLELCFGGIRPNSDRTIVHVEV